MKNYTFGQAKALLGNSAYLHGDGDIGAQIDAAVQALAGLSGWEFLRRLVRTISAGPVLTLPQGSADLIRVCINGRPASLRDTDYQFLHSGPGDLDRYIGYGFSLLGSGDVADLGYSPIASVIREPVCFVAVSRYVDVPDGDGNLRPQAPVVITGTGVDGSMKKSSIPVVQGSLHEYPDYSLFDMSDAFASVSGVVLDAFADEYITLYMMDAHGIISLAAHCHPRIQVPKFRQYRISAQTPPPYDVLAEVRVDPLPLVDDDDIIPLPSLEPIKHMMLYNANLAMNEQQTAQSYLQMATNWLNQMQQADNTLQTPVVQNVLMEGSPGELTGEFWNL